MNTGLFFTRCLLAIFLLIQNIELLLLRKEWSNSSPWRTENLAADLKVLPVWLRILLQWLWQPRQFSIFIVLRILAALCLPWQQHWLMMMFVLVSTLVILLRWRGAFNGGSDFISLIVITALLLAAISPHSPKLQLGALWYIAVQATVSYFLAGWVKIKRRSWRSGKALSDFIKPRLYPLSALSRMMIANKGLSFFAAWLVLGFELSFPILYWQPALAASYLAAGVIFHLFNVYIFGLNRFFWAWLCTYPAIYYCSHL